MAWLSRRTATLVSPDQALPGRTTPMRVPAHHDVHRDRWLVPPFPAGLATAVFGMGCFWGAERQFWQLPGVWTTAVGYAGGHTPNPTYREVCLGRTAHAEVVLVVFDPATVSYQALLQAFWEGHNPTQGMRQSHDMGTQYRSAVYWQDATQEQQARTSATTYQQALTNRRLGQITTEIAPLRAFYYAEDHHQQYLNKNPGGYCGIGGTGVTCPVAS